MYFSISKEKNVGNKVEQRCVAAFTQATTEWAGPPQPTKEKVLKYDKDLQSSECHREGR